MRKISKTSKLCFQLPFWNKFSFLFSFWLLIENEQGVRPSRLQYTKNMPSRGLGGGVCIGLRLTIVALLDYCGFAWLCLGFAWPHKTKGGLSHTTHCCTHATPSPHLDEPLSLGKTPKRDISCFSGCWEFFFRACVDFEDHLVFFPCVWIRRPLEIFSRGWIIILFFKFFFGF